MTVGYEFHTRLLVRHAGGSEADHGITPPTDTATLSLSLLSEIIPVVETLIIFLAAIAAKAAYINGFLQSTQTTVPYAGIGIIGAFTALIVFRRSGTHDPQRLLRHQIETRQLFSGLCFTMLILLLALYLLKVSDQYSRGWMLTWFALAYLFLLAERMIVQLYTRGLAAKGRLAQRIAICGKGPISERVRDYLASNPSVRVVGLFDDRREPVCRGDGKIDGGLENLIALGQHNLIDRVIVALPVDDEQRIHRTLDELSVLPNDIDLCPEFPTPPCVSYTTYNIGPLRLFEVLRTPRSDWDDLIKTLVDYVLATIGFVALLPLFAIIAIAIKYDSKGPVFFIQSRHGYNHRLVRVFKFRTMTVCEDVGPIAQTKKYDKRVTRIGRFLRRTSLDELPQLINVLKGEMSLVGPRPHALAHNEFYSKQVKRYASRHRVKPGITGWAQVNGYRGETADAELMRKRVEHDLWYIKNWSLRLDFEIMLRTLLVGFVNPQAY